VLDTVKQNNTIIIIQQAQAAADIADTNRLVYVGYHVSWLHRLLGLPYIVAIVLSSVIVKDVGKCVWIYYMLTLVNTTLYSGSHAGGSITEVRQF